MTALRRLCPSVVALFACCALLVMIGCAGTSGDNGNGGNGNGDQTLGTVRGKVVDQAGRGIGGAQVQLTSSIAAAPVMTEADGTFTMRNVSFGTYAAVATYTSATLGFMSGRSPEFTLSPTTPVVDLEPIVLAGGGPPPPPF